MGTYYCPNQNCPTKKLKEGEKCPQCGAEAKTFGFRDTVALMTSKKKHERVNEKLENGSVELIVN